MKQEETSTSILLKRIAFFCPLNFYTMYVRMWSKNGWEKVSDWQITSHLNYFPFNPPMSQPWAAIRIDFQFWLEEEEVTVLNVNNRNYKPGCLKIIYKEGSDGEGHLNGRRKNPWGVNLLCDVFILTSDVESLSNRLDLLSTVPDNIPTSSPSWTFTKLCTYKDEVHSFSSFGVPSLFNFSYTHTRGVMHGL